MGPPGGRTPSTRAQSTPVFLVYSYDTCKVKNVNNCSPMVFSYGFSLKYAIAQGVNTVVCRINLEGQNANP
jgi:hypothetical protein